MDDRTYHRLVKKAFGNAQKRSAAQTYDCLYPGCSERAIKSHSQQRRGALKAIAESDLVYAVQRNHYQHLKKLPNSPILVPTLTANASTFYGFCSMHDQLVFDPIEKGKLTGFNPESAFLMCLRAIAYECATKRRVKDWTVDIVKELRPFADPTLVEHFEVLVEAREIFLARDGDYYLRELFDALEEKNYDRIASDWKTVPKNIGVSCCCCYSPLLDTHDDYMKMNWGEPQPLITVNIVPQSAETHVVAAWLIEIEPHCTWIGTELSQPAGLECFINKSAFEESEDTCVRPSLWESVEATERVRAELAMLPEYIRGPCVSPPRIVQL